MQLLELFPTIIGVSDCDTFDRNAPAWRAEIAKAIKEREQKIGTPQYQTDDRLHERQELAELIEFFRRCSAEYLHALRYKPSIELRVECCWANCLVGADHFEMHQHANSFLSGAFYLDVSETAKPLMFRDPRPQNRVLDIPVEEELRVNRRYYAIEPSNGRLVLFPSWLEHRVRASFSSVPRISLSFNMSLHGEVGSAEELTRATM